MNDRNRQEFEAGHDPDRSMTTADLADAAQRERDAHDPNARFDDARFQPPASERERAQRDSGSGAERNPTDEPAVALFAPDETSRMRGRWDDIQARFVDDPRRAVEDADHLVAEAIQRLAESFARGRSDLEHQWGRGDGVSTEDLRIALRRYRSFFNRLLAV